MSMDHASTSSGSSDDALPAAVLFDMDGTLIDSEGLWLDAEHDVMGRLGGSWTDADQRHCLGGPLERVADYMLERSGASASREEVSTWLLDAMEQRLRAGEVLWRPGARALLLECRAEGVPTALVSASWNRLIDAVREQVEADLGMVAFDAVVAGDDVEHSKPHPDPYLTAAALLQTDPRDALALEDSPTGVTSAVSAGCRVVAIPHITMVDAPKALVIDSLEGWTLAPLWREVLRAETA
jgi:HAD superfamily hydrolase (TIGR01509 family)